MLDSRLQMKRESLIENMFPFIDFSSCCAYNSVIDNKYLKSEINEYK